MNAIGRDVLVTENSSNVIFLFNIGVSNKFLLI